MQPASKHLLHMLLLVSIAMPGIGQNEDEPYFSLTSSRTFASNGRPSISMGAWNVPSLEFRVYRVNDPLKFFEQLDDAHQFGGRVQRPAHETTWLENIHGWKRGVRASIRRNLRGQFTESPSAHFMSAGSTPQSIPTKGTQYAETPVLNPDQLVLTFVQPVHSTSRWESQVVNIDVKKKGVYLVEAVHKDMRAYTILMVSDIVSLTKAGKGNILTFVADRRSGEPIQGAEIHEIAHQGGGSKVEETNKDGIALFKPPPIESTRSEEELRFVVRRGGDIAVTTLSSYSFAPDRDRLTGYVYTDRPVYRPGHTVHFKGILRLKAATGYEVPAAQQVSVEIQDTEQKQVYQKKLTTSANGTVQDELALAPTAALGTYSITIHFGENQASGDFEVEEYKKPEYEVRVTPVKARVLEGDTVQATIEARYYFGEPVPGAKVKYSVYRSRYWFPLWSDADEEMSDNGDSGNPDDQASYGADNDQILEEEGVLDQDGKLNITFKTTMSEHRFDNRYRIEAHVTDEAKREITGANSVIATYGSFLVNIDPNRYFYSPNTTGSFTVQARDYDNKPVQTRAHVELLLWNWKGDNDNAQVKAAVDVNTGADGTAPANLTIPSQDGSYRVRVTAQTPEGRKVESYTYIWVAGAGRANWYGSQDKTVQIVPDKKSYRPGDTARILIVTGKADTPVLVAVEGRDLRMQRLIRSTGPTATFEVPVTLNDEPAIFITADFVRNGDLYQSTKMVKVPAVEHRLNVHLSTDKSQYLPGESATYKVDVTGADGKPVPRADLSVGVVDEAIYAIRPDHTPDILNYFFGHEWNAVYTENSLNYYFNGEAGKRRMRLAQFRPQSRLAQLKPERLVQPKVRKAFPDTAFWAADVVTDLGGHATAKVPFPDSLTTWRATARAITSDTKVGSATLKTIVRKNLILRLAVPRFFVQGDEVVISAIVHNYLTSEKKARVSLEIAGLDVLDGKTTDIQIPSRGEVKLDWRVRAQRVRTAKITGSALTDEESDALELELPINPPGVKLAQSKGGSLSNSANAAFSLTFPQQVEPGSRSLTIHVAPSIAGSLFGALEYLTAFPYGCVEQTMSSFLPNIIVRKTIHDLGLKENIDEAALQQKINAGLERLYNFQHEDGGWGWWETDDTHPFMTAYVVAGLAQARDAGSQVKQEALDKGVEWLQKNAVPDAKLLPDLRAYIGYALAVSVPQNARPVVDQLYTQRSKLSPYGLALLGLSLEILKDPKSAEIAATVESQAKQDEQQAWWPASRDPMLDFSGDVTPEATAYVVKFLSHERPQTPLLPKAALWLMNNRNEGYWWSSTKQTAMVIYGLTDFLKSTNEMNPNLNATVYVNDQAVLTKHFDAASASVDSELVLDETKLQPGENRIRVTGSGQGRVYYSARAEYFSSEQKLQKTGTVSLNILRDYFKLTKGKDGDKIVYDLDPLNGSPSSGDTIAVRLTVTGSDWKYLLVEDPIPAGTEFIERDSSYELRNKPPWWEYYFTRREMHDDRMAIFQTYFPQGQKEYFYLLKVVNPGAFTVSPARVQPMYQPSFLSTTESRRLEVK